MPAAVRRSRTQATPPSTRPAARAVRVIAGSGRGRSVVPSTRPGGRVRHDVARARAAWEAVGTLSGHALGELLDGLGAGRVPRNRRRTHSPSGRERGASARRADQQDGVPSDDLPEGYHRGRPQPKLDEVGSHE